MDIEVRTVTRERWADLEALFTRSIGPRGGKPVTQGCWCMFWRADKATFERGWGRAVAHAQARGATTVEGYPSKPGDDDPFTGLESMFAAAGFEQVRPGRRRSVWRRHV